VRLSISFDTISVAACERRIQFDPGNPEQFCIPLNGLNDGVTLCVAPYPVVWRVEIVEDEARYGFEYVRSGQIFSHGVKRLIDTPFQFLLAKQENCLGSSRWSQRQWGKGEVPTVVSNELQLI